MRKGGGKIPRTESGTITPQHLVEKALFSRRIILIAITNVVTSLGSLITLPLLTKYLSVGDYGIWVEVAITTTLVPMIAGLGMGWGMIRFLSVKKDLKTNREGFYSILIVMAISSGVLSILFATFAGPISLFLFGGRTDIIRLVSVAFFFECLNAVIFTYFRTKQRIDLFSAALTGQTFLLIALLALLLYRGYGLADLVMALAVTRAVLFVVGIAWVVKTLGVKWPKFTMIRRFIRFGLPNVPSEIPDWLLSSSDRYLIEIFIGITFVGYYNPGYALGALIITFISPLRLLLPPALSKLYDEGKKKEVRTFLGYSLKYFLVLAIPASIGLSLLSRPLLEILSTSDIAEHGYFVMPFIAWAMTLFGVQIIFSQVFLLKKKTKISGAIMLTMAIVAISLNLLLLPRIGLLGAALSALIAYTFAFVVTTYLAFTNFPFKVDGKALAKVLVASSAMGLLIYFMQPYGLLMTAVTIVLGLGVYSLGLVGLKVFSRTEYRFFWGLISAMRTHKDGPQNRGSIQRP